MNNDFSSNILIVGVGGQGTLLASRILGEIASILGYQCKLSEVHGMSQRGGSVVTHARIGKEVLSPIICAGEADVIMAFEEIEAARWCHYLKSNGIIIANSQKILPMPVIMGKENYPQNTISMIEKSGKRVLNINAIEIAIEAGSSKAVNVVLIGVFCAINNIPIETAKLALSNCVKERFLDINLLALNKGYLYSNKNGVE